MMLPGIKAELNFNGLNVLYQIARIISTGGQLDHIMTEILRALEVQSGMKRGMISILNIEQTELIVEIALGVPDHLRQKGKYRLGEGITGQVAQTGRAIAIPKLQNEPTFLDRTGARKDLHLTDLAFLCVPIRAKDVIVGVLSVDRVAVEEHVTLEGELQFLEAIANFIAQTVEQRREQAEEINRLEQENLQLRHILENRGRPDDMIGNSGSMREVYRHIAQVAPSITTVLIRGETGTGKELVAQAIHQKSRLKGGPFLAINCAALPESLIESELFGHEKGAFTNAISSHIGKFEAAHNGTLFLDEIGELPPTAQARLLRAIQEKEIQKIGNVNTIKVNVRLITATNRDLEIAVQKGTFREDLFYRLNVFTVALPPLRERGADILLLSDHFIKKYSKLHRKQIDRISTPAIEMLSAYRWPGNVRELENVMERAVLVAEENVVEGHDLPPQIQQTNIQTGNKPGTFENLVESYEKELIIDALKDSNGNQTDAADLLKTTKRIIQYKIEKFNIDYRKFRKSASRISL
jgi:Nif-specific regulatory protein